MTMDKEAEAPLDEIEADGEAEEDDLGDAANYSRAISTIAKG